MSARPAAERSPAGRDRGATIVAGVVIVALLAIYVAALLPREVPRLGASLQEILEEPDDVVGERWAVSAEVREVVGDQLILVGGREFGISPVPVLLTSRARAVTEDDVAPGDVGQFVGRFRRLDVAQLERELRADLPDARLEDLEQDVVLVADEAAVDQRVR